MRDNGKEKERKEGGKHPSWGRLPSGAEGEWTPLTLNPRPFTLKCNINANM